MRMQSIVFGVIVSLCVVGAIALAFVSLKNSTVLSNEPLSFQECADAGFPITESYPRTCRIQNGMAFTEDVIRLPEPNPPEQASSSLQVRVSSPLSGTSISSPLHVTGEAWGNWFFEGSFPIRLENDEGEIIAQAVAQAQGEWMTENFVPFIATLTWTSTSTGSVTLVLQKDNPSGLPEHDGSISIPLTISEI